MFPSHVYRERRIRLIGAMKERSARGLVFLHAHSQSPRNYPDNCYPFRQDSNWLYFIGLDEPDMAACIDIDSGNTILFGNRPTVSDMIWTGPSQSLEEYTEMAGIEELGPYEKAKSFLETASSKGRAIHRLRSFRQDVERMMQALLGEAQKNDPQGKGLAEESAELIASIVSLREIKEDREISELEKAIEASASVHSSLRASLLSGWTELEAKRHVERTASLLGFDMSFSTIATVRGETLHNHPTTRACRHGDLFLLDAGVESEMGYAGDLTSSFPVSPSFTPRQAELYRLVLDAFESTIRTLAPNRLFLDVHREACRTIVKGLKDLGIMKGDVEEAVESGAHALFFPHGIGHLIGLDVHDMEAMGEDKVGYADTKRSSQFGLRSLRLAKALKPGMVHSVEPGIYFIPGLIELWKAEHRFGQYIDYGTLQEWIGVGGIRIEDDWVVLSDGSRRLGPEVDKSLPAVEEARKMAYEKSPGSLE